MSPAMERMERRTLLATVGIGAATVAAGCLSRSNESDDPETDTTPSDDTDPASAASTNDGAGSETADERIASGETDRRTVGSGDLDGDGLRTPHTVALANRTDETVEATFEIRRDDAAVLDERLTLEADASIAISLTELARYEVEASVSGAATTETIGLDAFGCNGGQTTIRIQPDGRFETGTISTLLACPGVVTERIAAGESVEHTIGGGFGAGGSDDGGAGDDGSSDDGGSEEQHSLGLHNPTQETWTLRAVLADSAGVLFDGVFTLEANASVNLPIAEPADYEFDASVLETDASASEAVPSEQFDCNVSSTNATVDADGELAIRTISTMIACDASADDRSTNESD